MHLRSAPLDTRADCKARDIVNILFVVSGQFGKE